MTEERGIREVDHQGLVLLAEPYVSDFLQDTILTLNLAVVEVEPLPLLRGDVRKQIVDSVTAHKLINDPHLRVYMNSENALAFYLRNLEDENRRHAMTAL